MTTTTTTTTTPMRNALQDREEREAAAVREETNRHRAVLWGSVFAEARGEVPAHDEDRVAKAAKALGFDATKYEQAVDQVRHLDELQALDPVAAKARFDAATEALGAAFEKADAMRTEADALCRDAQNARDAAKAGLDEAQDAQRAAAKLTGELLIAGAVGLPALPEPPPKASPQPVRNIDRSRRLVAYIGPGFISVNDAAGRLRQLKKGDQAELIGPLPTIGGLKVLAVLESVFLTQDEAAAADRAAAKPPKEANANPWQATPPPATEGRIAQ